MIVLLIIWWTHMVRGQSPSRCQPRLNYSRSTLYAAEGGVLSFQCNATYCGKNSSKPRLYWCKQKLNSCTALLHLDEFANRTKMSSYFGSGTLTSLLQISPVLIKHSGKYQCRAQFPNFDQITAMGHLITALVISKYKNTECMKLLSSLISQSPTARTYSSITVHLLVMLRMAQPVTQLFRSNSSGGVSGEIKVFTPVNKVSGHRGGSLKLQCIAQSDTHLNTTLGVHWTKDNEKCNEPLSRNKSNDETIASGRQRFTLTLSNLQPDDAGLYYCCITSHLSSQIFGMDSIRVHVTAFNPDVINFASLIICKGILLVIVITFGLTWVYHLEKRQQKSEDAAGMSQRKEMRKSSIT
ncbi:uncharacterized protein LOC132405776 [Hypanus sabinus]|uniref:uncharacterized protein LOC132405776 n=1 Tax=Hypanus sabinus TaxID=79690 RepID=UPI0028C3FEE8|nr:uncharacterized protein LOC132405776 [Hypanus sabinus]